MKISIQFSGAVIVVILLLLSGCVSLERYPESWAPLETKRISVDSLLGTFDCSGTGNRLDNLGNVIFWDALYSCDKLRIQKFNVDSIKFTGMLGDTQNAELVFEIGKNYYVEDNTIRLKTRIETANANIAVVWTVSDLLLLLDKENNLIIKTENWDYMLALVVIPGVAYGNTWVKYKRVSN